VNDLSGGGGGVNPHHAASVTSLSTFGQGRIAASSPIDRYQSTQQGGGYYPMTYGMMSGPGRPSLRSPEEPMHHHHQQHHLQELNHPPIHHLQQHSNTSFNPSDSE
jgi:hypothetical protein